MPSLPTVHVLHVDGNILEMNNSSSDGGAAVGNTSGAGNMAGSGGGGGGGGVGTGTSINTSSTSSASAAVGGVGAASSSAAAGASPGDAVHINIARPLISPPTVSGVGCAPLQEESGAATKSRLNITSVISNSNVGNRKMHHTNNSSSVMTHKTQMQMALQRKMNNLTLKQMNAGHHGSTGAAVGTGIEHGGLLAEGIAVRGQQNINASGSHFAPNNSKRLQVVLPTNDSEYAVRKGVAALERHHELEYRETPGSVLSSPVSTTATYSPLLPSSGFSSPLVHHKYGGGAAKTPNTNLSSGSRTASTPPSTSGSGGFSEYYGAGRGQCRGHSQEAFDGMLVIDADAGSVPTSESCSPHVRLCGSRASCGPMWTNEDLTMLDMAYDDGNGTTPSSSGNPGSKMTMMMNSDSLMVVGTGEGSKVGVGAASKTVVAKKKLMVGDDADDDTDADAVQVEGDSESAGHGIVSDVRIAVQAMKAMHLPTTA